MAQTTFSGPVVSTNGFTKASATVTTFTTINALMSINGTTIIISDLPTSDPVVAGQIYSDSGVLTVSAGA